MDQRSIASNLNSIESLGASLYKAKGVISRSIQRLIHCELLAYRRPNANDSAASNRKFYEVRRDNLREFLNHGIRHTFVPERLGYGRGIATGWHCSSIDSEMHPPAIAYVWPASGGNCEGELLEPLYPDAHKAASMDQALYEMLALIDIVRTGKPRELRYAREILARKVDSLRS